MMRCNIVRVTEHFGILWFDKNKDSCFYQARKWNRKYFLKGIIPTTSVCNFSTYFSTLPKPNKTSIHQNIKDLKDGTL